MDNHDRIYCFAALALYMLTKDGDLDMGGGKHGAVNAPATFELKT